jgi:hypothetical protein
MRMLTESNSKHVLKPKKFRKIRKYFHPFANAATGMFYENAPLFSKGREPSPLQIVFFFEVIDFLQTASNFIDIVRGVA